MKVALELTRRGLIAGSLPAIAVGASTVGPTSKASAKDQRIIEASAFGAKGDGTTDDHAAITAALRVGQVVSLGPGCFRISAPIKLNDGKALRGAGRGGWEPYDGRGPPPALGRTTVMVDTGLAIDASGSSSVEISSLAIASRDGQQSAWARPAGYQDGTVGIDIVGALQFCAHDVSFHGLEVGLSAVANEGQTAQMPSLDKWSAHDCSTVLRLVSELPDYAPVRDARISGCIAALHCGSVIEAKYCDGLRIENCRFFQCTRNAVMIENTPFVNIVGTTMFETTDATMLLRGCTGTTMSGVQLVRAGFYRPPPAAQQPAVILDRCSDLSFEGLIERPMGRAFTILDSHNVSISGTIANPFWSTGSLGDNDGAIYIERSSSILIQAAFSGGDYWMAVIADAPSAPTVAGRITTQATAGVIRCVSLQNGPLGHVIRLAASTSLTAGETVKAGGLRIFVPARSALVSRSISVTSDGVEVEAGNVRWNSQLLEPGGGSLSLTRHTLHINADRSGHYALIPIGLHNPNTRDVIVPEGCEVGLSLAIEPL